MIYESKDPYRRLRNLTYDDSFGTNNLTSCMECIEDIHEETESDDVKIEGYTKRQSQIIKMCIPEDRERAKPHELKLILKKAETREDEYVIDQILTNYRDDLDKDTYDVPEIDPDAFDEIIDMFSSF